MAERSMTKAEFTTEVELNAEEMIGVRTPLYWQNVPRIWLSGVILYGWNFEKGVWYGSLDGFCARVKKDGTLYDEVKRLSFYGEAEAERLIEKYRPTGTPEWRIIEGMELGR